MPTSPGTLETRSPGGLAQSSNNEFPRHPDHRVVAAFILGWVFWYSLQVIYNRLVPQVARHLHTYRSSRTAQSQDLEQNTFYEDKARKASLTSGVPEFPTRSLPRRDSHVLFFTLMLCFVFASVANFASLVSFETGGSNASCAFFVAWGTMASNTAPHVGLFILSLHLRQLGVSLTESVAFWVTQCLSIVFIFVTASVGIGYTKTFDPLKVAFCYQKHFLPSSLVTSLLNLAILGYALPRFVSLTTSFRELLKNGIMVALDSWFIRAVALLTFELLVLVPNATPTNLLGEFIPFSIGAILVIAAFNSCFSQGQLPSMLSKDLKTDKSQSNMPPVLALDISPSVVDLTRNQALQPYFPNHPYATTIPARTPSYQLVTTPQSEVIQTAITGFSEYTFNSTEARSVDGAQIRTVSRLALRHTPDSTPTPSIASSVGEVGEAPWQLSAAFGKYGKILPPKEQYAIAEQFEREDALRTPYTPGLAPGPPRRPSRPTVVIENYLNNNSGVRDSRMLSTAISQNSAAVYGSDIIRAGSGVKDRTKKHQSMAREQARASWSPFSVASRSPTSVLGSTMLSPESRANTARHSFAASDLGSTRRPQSSGGLHTFFARNGLSARPQRSRTFGSEDAPQSQAQGESQILDIDVVEREVSTVSPSSFARSGFPANPRMLDTVGVRPFPVIRGPRPPPVSIPRHDIAGRSSHYVSVHFWPTSISEWPPAA